MGITARQKGLLITTLGAVAIVPDSLLIRLNSADTATIIFWRALLTAMTVTIYMLWRDQKGLRSQWRNMCFDHLLYAFGIIGSAVFFVIAINTTTVANTVFILATMPMLAAIMSWLWFKEAIDLRLGITMVFVMLGVAIIAYGSGESAQASLLGDGFAFLTTLSFAFAMTVARRAKTIEMMPAIPPTFLFIALATLPFATPFSLVGWDPIYMFLHGAVFIPVAMILFSIGPRYISSAEVSLLILLETVLAPILAWAVIGEHPGRWALIGGFVVMCTLVVSNLSAMRAR